MPYISRDSAGKISGVFEHAEVGVGEEIGAADPELKRFLIEQGLATPDSARQVLEESDRKMIRLVDDLIDLMIEKDVIKFTDLPPAAGEKYLHRQVARKRLQQIIVGEDDIL
jgi:hypothetical protein